MYLLNITTMRLEYFASPNQAPPYAILSHTWSINPKEPELLFHEWSPDVQERFRMAMLNDKVGSSLSGVNERKILNFCKVAVDHELGYGWIDNLCIDKRVCIPPEFSLILAPIGSWIAADDNVEELGRAFGGNQLHVVVLSSSQSVSCGTFGPSEARQRGTAICKLSMVSPRYKYRWRRLSHTKVELTVANRLDAPGTSGS